MGMGDQNSCLRAQITWITSSILTTMLQGTVKITKTSVKMGNIRWEYLIGLDALRLKRLRQPQNKVTGNRQNHQNFCEMGKTRWFNFVPWMTRAISCRYLFPTTSKQRTVKTTKNSVKMGRNKVIGFQAFRLKWLEQPCISCNKVTKSYKNYQSIHWNEQKKVRKKDWTWCLEAKKTQ